MEIGYSKLGNSSLGNRALFGSEEVGGIGLTSTTNCDSNSLCDFCSFRAEVIFTVLCRP